MEESDKNLILNKYLSNYSKYNKYFNAIFNIGYYIYKNIGYQDMSIFGGCLYYMIYKKYNINKKYFKYFQTLDIDIISIYKDLSCLYYKKIRTEIKNIIINDFILILNDKYIKKNVKIINKLLNKGKKNYEIKLCFKYFNTSSIKIQLIYSNDEISYHFIDFIISSQINMKINRYVYENKHFTGENLICSSIDLLTPKGYFWSVIASKFYKGKFSTTNEIYTYISYILTNNNTLYEKYIKNYIRAITIYNIMKNDNYFLYLNDIQSIIIKNNIHVLKTKFFRYILPDRYVNSTFLKKNSEYKTLEYYKFIIEVYLYINTKIIDNQLVNNDTYYYININGRNKKVVSEENKIYLTDLIFKSNKYSICPNYSYDSKDDNDLCYPKMKYLYQYL